LGNRISRRSLIEAAVAAGAALGGWARTAAADQGLAETDKIKQAEAHYQRQPKGQQRCSICLQFEAPAKCKIVQGPITSTGWCQYFAARENAH
jgi:hypothetical protein